MSSTDSVDVSSSPKEKKKRYQGSIQRLFHGYGPWWYVNQIFKKSIISLANIISNSKKSQWININYWTISLETIFSKVFFSY